MVYTPLTFEQYKKARESGFTDTQIVQMEARRQETESVEKRQPKERGFFETVVKAPIEATVLRPGYRTLEALGRFGALGTETQRGFEEMEGEDQILDIPFYGEFNVSAVRAGAGGIKQATGEAIETGAYLVSGGKAGSLVGGGVRQGMITGAKTGVMTGGLIGAGTAMQREGATTGEIIGETAVGVGAGGILGGAIGGVAPAVPALIKGIRETTEVGTSAARQLGQVLTKVGGKMRGVGETIARGVGTTPARIVERGIEKIGEVGAKAERIRTSLPHIREAIRNGIDDTTIKFLTTGSNIDKTLRADMLEIAQKAATDLSIIEQPKQIAGNILMKGPVQYLINIKDAAIRGTNSILGRLPKIKYDVTSVYTAFMQEMNNRGVTLQNGQFVIQQGSKILEEDLVYFQAIYNKLKPNNKGKTNFTFKEVHELRQYLFDKFDIAKERQQAFSETAVTVANSVRREFANIIDNASGGAYKKQQLKIAESLDGLRDLVQLLGFKGRLKDITSKDLKAGETFLRVFGNAADRPLSVLQKIYSTAYKYKYKGDENIINTLRFADMLESVYGAPSRSIGAQIAKSIGGQDPQQILASSIREMVKWSPYSGSIRLLRATGFIGKREQEVLKAFENLILKEAGRLKTEIKAPMSGIKESVGKIKEFIQQEAKDILKK